MINITHSLLEADPKPEMIQNLHVSSQETLQMSQYHLTYTNLYTANQ